MLFKYLLIVVLLLLSVGEAKRCTEVTRKAQSQPPGFPSTGSRQAFEEYIKKNLFVNKEIPKVCDESVRIATLNLTNMVTLSDDETRLGSALHQMDATALVLQFIPSSKDTYNRLAMILEAERYSYRTECSNSKGRHMIVSRVPLKPISKADTKDGTCILASGVRVGSKTIAIISTAIGDSTGIHLEETKQIIRYIKTSIEGSYPKVIMAASIGVGWGSPEVAYITGEGKLSEAFRSLKAPPPSSTNIKGIASDYYFISLNANETVLGAYTFQTSFGDYIPLLIDLDGAPEVPHSSIAGGTRWIWIVTGITSVVLFIVVITLLILRLWPRDDE